MTTQLKSGGPPIAPPLCKNSPIEVKVSNESHLSLAGFSIDASKTLIGTIVGAGLAFGSQSLLRRKAQKQENLASGVLALFAIRAQFDDFANFRNFFIGDIASTFAVQPDTPEWMLSRPGGFNFNSPKVYDFKALSFILEEKEGRQAFQKLQLAERAYIHLSQRHQDNNASASERQKKMQEICNDPDRDMEIYEIESALGPELVARSRDHFRSVLLCVYFDETRYTQAFSELKGALVKVYGSREKQSWFSRLLCRVLRVRNDAEYLNEIRLEDVTSKPLPPLPVVAQRYIDSVRKLHEN